MLTNVAIVLFRPKFSENVGSTARAMANMGSSELIVVSPQEWDEGRARALATAKGQDVLDSMKVVDDLEQALAPFETVYGTTARVGGWRKGVLTPETAALRAVTELKSGAKVAVLFGPEDKGLTNDETKVCGRLVTIPTAGEASSLNLAQAVLILLYEFMKATLAKPGRVSSVRATEGDMIGQACSLEDSGSDEPRAPEAKVETSKGGNASAPESLSRAATHKEREALFANLRETLLAIDFLKDDNPDYWMLPIRAFVERVKIKRNEFNLLMGFCRQVKWAVGRKTEKK
jgi:tRNA/rRNA methyltransferase